LIGSVTQNATQLIVFFSAAFLCQKKFIPFINNPVISTVNYSEIDHEYFSVVFMFIPRIFIV